MTAVVWWTLAVAIVSGTIGVAVGALLAAADHPWDDDADSIARWERCRHHLERR